MPPEGVFGALDTNSLHERDSSNTRNGKKRVRPRPTLVHFPQLISNHFQTVDDREQGENRPFDAENLGSQLSRPGSEVPQVTAKKARLIKTPIVDTRIELTDAELVASRTKYDEEQIRLSAEIAVKKKEKDAYYRSMEVCINCLNLGVNADSYFSDDLGGPRNVYVQLSHLAPLTSPISPPTAYFISVHLAAVECHSHKLSTKHSAKVT